MPEQNRETTLWIIKWQAALARVVKSYLLSSVLIFYVPVMVSGLILQVRYDLEFISRGLFFALSWLAIGPYLIVKALDHVDSFFLSHRNVFRKEDEWKKLHAQELKRLQSSKYLPFGLFWATAVSLVILLSVLENAPLGVKVWAACSFFVLFLLSSVGFYGVYVLITMMKRICSSDIVFNPFHPDKFGGISDFGRFSVKGALFFSSGALVFPLVIEVFESVSDGSDFFYALVYMLAGFFMLTMIAAFLIPILEIKRFVDPEKERLILSSREELDAMISTFKKDDELNVRRGAEILIHYYFYYSKLLEVKDYPYDLRTIWELGMSFILPVAIAAFEILSR